MSFVIKRNDGPAFFSPQVGADFGAPGSGWVGAVEDALQFVREKDAEQFRKSYLRGDEPFTTIVATP